MAWLDAVIGGANALMGGEGNAMTQLLSLFGANQALNKYNVAPNGETASNRLYQAMLNPNSPIMAKMTGQMREKNLGDFQTQLREMQLGDRRAAAMGRAPTFFQPERADEAIIFLTSRGLPQLNQMASEQAMQRLAMAAQGLGGFAPAQNERNIKSGLNMANNYSIPEQLMKMFTQGGFQQTPMR